jgi:methyl-accepting chemotaxis protein
LWSSLAEDFTVWELRRFTLGTRLFGILLCVFLFTVGILLFYYSEMQDLRKVATEQTGEIMMAGIQEKVQVGTHSLAIALSEVVADVEGYTAQERLLREAVKDLRFEADESGYYFIYRGTTAVTIPPNPDLRGQDLRNVSDENGVYFVRELAAAAQSGGGFVNYVFAKPEAGLQPKVSYAEMIPGTDYWIGTGVYADNVERRQAAVAALIREQTQRSMLKAGTVVLGFFGLVLVPLVSCLIRSILQPIRELRAVSKRIAAGDLLVNVAIYGQDEIANLLATMLRMREQLARVVTEMQRVGA